MATAPMTGSPSVNVISGSLGAGPYSNVVLLPAIALNTIAMVSVTFTKMPALSTMSIFGSGSFSDASTYVPFSFNAGSGTSSPTLAVNDYARLATQGFFDNTSGTPYAEPKSGLCFLYPGETLQVTASLAGTAYYVITVYQLSGS